MSGPSDFDQLESMSTPPIVNAANAEVERAQAGIVLVLLLGDFLHPITIMVALPFSIGGALMGLLILQTDGDRGDRRIGYINAVDLATDRLCLTLNSD